MRSIRRLLLAAGIVAAVTVLVGSSALAHETKTLSLVKDCATWPTTATCTVTASRPLRFLTGSVINYLQPASLPTPAGTDVVLRTANGRSSAPGHCMFVGASGLCTFGSGTGRLAGFHATLTVAWIVDTATFSLIGPYSFDRGDDGNEDRGD